MNKFHLLAALLVASSAVYGAGNQPTNIHTNTNNSTMKHNQSTQRGNQNSHYLAANDQRYANSDQKLTKDIHNKLSSGLFSKGYEQVNVDVRNGDVTLTGSVQTQSDKDKVEKEVRNLSGVKSLNSRIAITDKTSMMDKDVKKARDSFATPADQQLNMKIRDKITGWFWDSYPDVFLNTANGVVVLQGFVKTPKDQQDLIVQLRKIEGVKDVKSNLKMKTDNR